MPDFDGQPSQTVTPPEVAGTQPAENPAQVAPDLTKYMADPVAPATEPTVPQGQPAIQPEQEFVPKSQLNEYQKMHQERILEAQARERALLAQLNEIVNAVKPPPNVPDKVNDPIGYLEWKMAENQKQMAEEAKRLYQAEFQQTIAQAQDMMWQQQHPNVDINLVKQFASQRGISRLDDAHALMTMNQQQATIAQNTAQQTLQQFRQPQGGAQPIRNNSQVPSPTGGLSFDKMLQDFNRNPGVYDTWPEPIRAAFDKELTLRNTIQ
jgi:hypothetical protein